ncbi:MAG: hypothetical protein E7189_03590 [Erysipelotrichaceae bacterium]|nr:hypothetical protein [Erysipelotrichaceae bacterium]
MQKIKIIIQKSLAILATLLMTFQYTLPNITLAQTTSKFDVVVQGNGQAVISDSQGTYNVNQGHPLSITKDNGEEVMLKVEEQIGVQLSAITLNGVAMYDYNGGNSYEHVFMATETDSRVVIQFDNAEKEQPSEKDDIQPSASVTEEKSSAQDSDVGQLKRRVARANDSGGAGGGSGSGGINSSQGGVAWTIHDNNDNGFGLAGTEGSPNVAAVKNAMRNMGVITTEELWHDPNFGPKRGFPTSDTKIAQALAEAIAQCRANYRNIYHTENGFTPRIVAIGVAYGVDNGHIVYNGSSRDPYESDWLEVWNYASSNRNLTLNHNGQSYKVDTPFHNGNQSLSGFALNQLRGQNNIRVIVLDESQPFPAKGNLQISKSSALPDITDGNDCYGTMEGAQYGLYTDANATNQIGTFTIGADGNSNVIEDLDIATYYIKELKAPKHYALDPTIYSIEVQSGQTVRKDLKDIPQTDPVRVLLGKVDLNTTLNRPQGSASLENAEFTVKYYDHLTNDGEGGEPVNPETLGLEPTRMWVLRTDEDGFADLSPEYVVSGDELYYAQNGSVTLPLGTVTIQETKAPVGYKLSDEIFVREITSKGPTENVETYNQPTIKEEIHHAKFTLVKFITDADASEVVKPEVGAEFTAVLEKYYDEANGDMAAALELAKANGSDMEYSVLKTDERGEAVSNDLAFGTYVVKQTSVGENGTESWEFDQTFKVVITNEGNETVSYGELQDGRKIDQSFDKMVHFYINNIPFTSGLKIVKQDADSGKTVSLSSAAFKIKKVDEEGQPVANYSKKTIKTDENGFVSVKVGSAWYNTFVTNADNRLSVSKAFVASEDEDKGSVTVPLALPAGDYLLSETNVPKGYLNGEDVAFKITKSNITGTDADNQPLVTVVMKNKTPKGEIKLKKTFEDPNNRLGGKVSFKLVADTDVIDPADGSIIYHAGDVVGTYDLGDDDTITVSNLPMGLGEGVSYSFVETETYGNYKLDETPQQATFTKNDDVTEVYSENVSFKNELLKIKTEAITETNNHKALASKKVKFVDKVMYEGLIVGKDYTVKGKLMNKETGEPLLVDGEEITGETTFTAEKSDGSIDVVFELDSSALAGQTVVVFEDLYRNGIKVAIHADIKDKDQSVEFVSFQIKVNKVDSITKKNIISKDFEFTMYKDKDLKEVVKTLSGNIEDGTATFEVTEGVWFVKETKAPQGYKLSDEVVKVEVEDNKLYVNDQEVDPDSDYLYSIVYQNALMPSNQIRTGVETNAWILYGLLGISLGAVIILLKKKES